MSKISVNNIPIANFSPDVLKYTNIEVDSNIVSIDAKRSSDTSMVFGLGKVFVREGSDPTVREITVTAENGEKKIYVLELHYEKKKEEVKLNDNNKLDSLELLYNNNKIDFNFDNSKTSYDIKLNDSNIDKVKINATLSDSKASFVSKYGPRDVTINYGKNKIEIKVKAEDGNIKTYTLNVTREDNRSSDNSLKMLTVNGEEIKLENDIYEYSVLVSYDVLKSNILAEPSVSTAKVEYNDIDLEIGENSPILIKVIAENGKVQEYKVTITRQEEEEKFILKNITIVGYDLPFDVNVTTYDLNVNKDDKKLEITYDPVENISVEVLNNGELRNGSVVKINVVDDEGEKNYSIHIHKKIDQDLITNIICYGVFIIGLALFICSIVVANKRKKK